MILLELFLIILQEFILDNTSLGAGDEYEGKDLYYRFSFYDSTEELESGKTTSWTVLNAKVKQELTDNVSPSIVVNPFYWESASDNSLYKNSKENGHIELEKHLENGNFTESSGIYDKDPKLSGKVKIQGTVNDNKILKDISVKIPGFTASDNYISLAQYTKGSGWACDNDVESSLNSKGFAFTVDSDEITQENGHTVTWTLIWDTSKIYGVAKADVKINFKAEDQSSNYSGESTTATTENAKTSYYRVDVVPYITSVSRNVKYNRARSGAIPLLRDDTNSETGNFITGFNLGTSIASDQTKLFGVSDSAKGETLAINFSNTNVSVANSKITFRVRSGTKDGYVSIKVNEILNLNNINDNSAEYNKENIENQWFTNEWTDDRFVRIWQDKDTFGNEALAKDIAYPAMAMSEDGVLYSSFTNYTKHSVYYAKINDNSPQEVFNGYDAPEETTISVKGSGSSVVVNVGYMGNYQSGGDKKKWNPNLDAAGGYHVYDPKARIIYRSDHPLFRFEQLFHNQKFQQFQNFRLVRKSSDDDSNVHTAYYDKSTASIHYSVAVANTLLGSTGYSNKSEFCWVNIDGGSDNDDTIDFTNYTYTAPGGAEYKNEITSDGPKKNIKLSDSCFEDGMTRASSTSQFVGIDLMPLNTTTNRAFPVIVYFAGDCIRVARANADYPKGDESYWKVQRAVTNSSNKNYSMNYVTYVDCEVDSSGYLHIVFVNTSGELVYIKSTNNPSDGSKYTFAEPEVVTDGSPSCIDITTRGETPYIACISSINAVDGLTMAFKSDGKWEVMKSPLVHTVAQNRACIEAHPTPKTGWGEAAVGYYSNQDQRYHAAYYIGNGNGH